MSDQHSMKAPDVNLYAERIAGLRELADWLEKHPDLAAHLTDAFEIQAFPPDSPGEVARWARAFGSAGKEYGPELFKIKRSFGAVTLSAVFWRSTVCRRVVTGTRTIPAKTIPEQVLPERTEEIVEWECEPILGSRERGDSLLLAQVGAVGPDGQVAARRDSQ